MNRNRPYKHLIEIDETRETLVIYRFFADGSKQMFTEIYLGDGKKEPKHERIIRIARRLGEDLLIDSVEGRGILKM